MSPSQLGVVSLHITVSTCQTFLETHNIGLEWEKSVASFVYGTTFRMLDLPRRAYQEYLRSNGFRKSGALLLAMIYSTREADSKNLLHEATKLNLKHYVHIANLVAHHLGPRLMEKLDFEIRCATRQIWFRVLLNNGNMVQADIV